MFFEIRFFDRKHKRLKTRNLSPVAVWDVVLNISAVGKICTFLFAPFYIRGSLRLTILILKKYRQIWPMGNFTAFCAEFIFTKIEYVCIEHTHSTKNQMTYMFRKWNASLQRTARTPLAPNSPQRVSSPCRKPSTTLWQVSVSAARACARVRPRGVPRREAVAAAALASSVAGRLPAQWHAAARTQPTADSRQPIAARRALYFQTCQTFTFLGELFRKFETFHLKILGRF